MVSRAEERVSAGGVTQQDNADRGWFQVSQQIGGGKVLLLSERAAQDQSWAFHVILNPGQALAAWPH